MKCTENRYLINFVSVSLYQHSEERAQREIAIFHNAAHRQRATLSVLSMFFPFIWFCNTASSEHTTFLKNKLNASSKAFPYASPSFRIERHWIHGASEKERKMKYYSTFRIRVRSRGAVPPQYNQHSLLDRLTPLVWSECIISRKVRPLLKRFEPWKMWHRFLPYWRNPRTLVAQEIYRFGMLRVFNQQTGFGMSLCRISSRFHPVPTSYCHQFTHTVFFFYSRIAIKFVAPSLSTFCLISS